MTPEERSQFEAMSRQVEELMNFMRTWEQSGQLDPQTTRTIQQLIGSQSGKSVGSENQTVNEAGAATYSVLGTPDGWTKIGDANVPTYND